eukprot:TRINITY_DN2088_c0_g1_i2.p1 TRINITY_DN2088_c0_g1~~TRINITY_DN2088_c0_g1_i2.p1  ORF type:complete len:677 (+),score=126.41 TRINITY_DN2088_c0_g1_i2:604-2634(+)
MFHITSLPSPQPATARSLDQSAATASQPPWTSAKVRWQPPPRRDQSLAPSWAPLTASISSHSTASARTGPVCPSSTRAQVPLSRSQRRRWPSSAPLSAQVRALAAAAAAAAAVPVAPRAPPLCQVPLEEEFYIPAQAAVAAYQTTAGKTATFGFNDRLRPGLAVGLHEGSLPSASAWQPLPATAPVLNPPSLTSAPWPPARPLQPGGAAVLRTQGCPTQGLGGRDVWRAASPLPLSESSALAPSSQSASVGVRGPRELPERPRRPRSPPDFASAPRQQAPACRSRSPISHGCGGAAAGPSLGQAPWVQRQHMPEMGLPAQLHRPAVQVLQRQLSRRPSLESQAFFGLTDDFSGLRDEAPPPLAVRDAAPRCAGAVQGFATAGVLGGFSAPRGRSSPPRPAGATRGTSPTAAAAPPALGAVGGCGTPPPPLTGQRGGAVGGSSRFSEGEALGRLTRFRSPTRRDAREISPAENHVLTPMHEMSGTSMFLPQSVSWPSPPAAAGSLLSDKAAPAAAQSPAACGAGESGSARGIADARDAANIASAACGRNGSAPGGADPRGIDTVGLQSGCARGTATAEPCAGGRKGADAPVASSAGGRTGSARATLEPCGGDRRGIDTIASTAGAGADARPRGDTEAEDAELSRQFVDALVRSRRHLSRLHSLAVEDETWAQKTRSR